MKIKFKRFILLLTSILLSCNSQREEREQTFTINDARGEVKVFANSTRVVALTSSAIESLLALNIKPVAAVLSRGGTLEKPWHFNIIDKMSGIEVVGEETLVNLEKLAKVKPDLILGSISRQAKIAEHLDSIAPTVLAKENLADFKGNFTLFAKALRREREAKEILESWNLRIEHLKKELKEKRNKKISLARFSSNNLEIYKKNTFAGSILDELGFKRVASQEAWDFKESITKERISDLDGDVLIYFTIPYGKKDSNGRFLSEKVRDEWLSDHIMQNLKVIRENKIFEVDEIIWNGAAGIISANMVLDDIEKIKDKL